MSRPAADPDDPPPPTDRPLGLRGSRTARALTFVRRVLVKADEDGIFFMAGAISFNLLVAIVPLLVFAVGISGMVLSARFVDPATVILDLVSRTLPAIQGDVDLAAQVRDTIAELVSGGTGFTVVGGALLVWFSTRLVGTLRTVLREVFDIGQSRGIIRGKLFDILVVLIGGLLFLVNILLTTGVGLAESRLDLLGLEDAALSTLQTWSAQLLAFVSIWVLFLGIYRYLPARHLPWRAALIAASFTAVLHEFLKAGFGWYVSDVANYRSTYGNLISLAVLFFWIYYGSIGFILGGEVAQVWTMRRARRAQVRRVHGGMNGGDRNG
ncbi:MAG TPA: YihY/virulence factor BrkB family protein [Longimicrobiales bacterium]|nr:YihY/virulence factor BrkB family protein [Longimicrobiales bacterium]